MAAQLRAIIDEILRRKNWRQERLGKEIGVRQPTVSKMRRSDDWNLHWQAFVGLLPLLAELKIDPAKELQASVNPVDKSEAFKDEVGKALEATHGHGREGKDQSPQAVLHPVPPRGTPCRKRKRS